MYRLVYTTNKTTREQQDAMFVTLSGLPREELRKLTTGNVPGNRPSWVMRQVVATSIATGSYILVSV